MNAFIFKEGNHQSESDNNYHFEYNKFNINKFLILRICNKKNMINYRIMI